MYALHVSPTYHAAGCCDTRVALLSPARGRMMYESMRDVTGRFCRYLTAVTLRDF